MKAETLARWRDDAEHRSGHADSHLVFALRIVALLDMLPEAWDAGYSNGRRDVQESVKQMVKVVTPNPYRTHA